MDVAVVTLPAVKMLLVAIMLLGILVEIKTGGMGAGVLLGLVAAAVFWGSQYVEGLVSLYMVAVFFAGILCIGVEMLLPTAGLLAGVGAALLLYSLVLALGGDVSAIGVLLGAALLAAARAQGCLDVAPRVRERAAAGVARRQAGRRAHGAAPGRNGADRRQAGRCRVGGRIPAQGDGGARHRRGGHARRGAPRGGDGDEVTFPADVA